MSSTDYLEPPIPRNLGLHISVSYERGYMHASLNVMCRVPPSGVASSVLNASYRIPRSHYTSSSTGGAARRPRASTIFGAPRAGLHLQRYAQVLIIYLGFRRAGIDHCLVNASCAPPPSFNYIFQRPASRAARSIPCTTFNSIFGVPARHLEIHHRVVNARAELHALHRVFKLNLHVSNTHHGPCFLLHEYSGAGAAHLMCQLNLHALQSPASESGALFHVPSPSTRAPAYPSTGSKSSPRRDPLDASRFFLRCLASPRTDATAHARGLRLAAISDRST
ncbi:hypothetical protein FB451DRAFT_1497126 [Mycena latifolia]|nr:hypothetical protein FB451DRAFT_1497126 [Mycena latifolia]